MEGVVAVGGAKKRSVSIRDRWSEVIAPISHEYGNYGNRPAARECVHACASRKICGQFLFKAAVCFYILMAVN